MSNFSFSVRHIIFFSIDVDLIAVIDMSFCVSKHATYHQYRITHGGDMMSYRLSRWCRCDAILLPYRTWWRHFLQKVYQHAKYRQDNSIHGRNVTISVLQKQTYAYAILKFFFRFRLWLHHRNPHDILHKVAQLHAHPTTQCRNVTSYLNTTCICWCHCLQKVEDCISKPNFVDIFQLTAEI